MFQLYDITNKKYQFKINNYNLVSRVMCIGAVTRTHLHTYQYGLS